MKHAPHFTIILYLCGTLFFTGLTSFTTQKRLRTLHTQTQELRAILDETLKREKITLDREHETLLRERATLMRLKECLEAKQ